MSNPDALILLAERVAEKYKLWVAAEACSNRRFHPQDDGSHLYICHECRRLTAVDNDVNPRPSFVFKTHTRRCPAFNEARSLFPLLGVYLGISGDEESVLEYILSELDKRVQ